MPLSAEGAGLWKRAIVKQRDVSNILGVGSGCRLTGHRETNA